MAFDTYRVLIVQNVQLAYHLADQPERDIVKVYMYGNDPNGVDGGIEVVKDIDRIALHFYAPRGFAVNAGEKYRLRLEKVDEAADV